MAYFESIMVAGAGVTTTSSGTSQSGALPTTADGRKAKFVLVTATTLAYVKFGAGTAPTCTLNDILVSSHGRVFNVSSQDFYAVLQETAAAVYPFKLFYSYAL